MVEFCPVEKWSGFQMASENWTLKCPIFKSHLITGLVLPFECRAKSENVNVRISGVRYSDDHCDSKFINQEGSISCDVYFPKLKVAFLFQFLLMH